MLICSYILNEIAKIQNFFRKINIVVFFLNLSYRIPTHSVYYL